MSTMEQQQNLLFLLFCGFVCCHSWKILQDHHGTKEVIDAATRHLAEKGDFAHRDIKLDDVVHVQEIEKGQYKMVLRMSMLRCDGTTMCWDHREVCAAEVLQSVAGEVSVDIECTEQDNVEIQEPESTEVDAQDMFEEFKSKYGRDYATEEEYQRRFSIFQENLAKAQKYQDLDRGTAAYGVTQFMDLTEEEFLEQYTSGPWKQTYDPSLKQAAIPSADPPEAFDWRDHNAVSEVKNQGSCGSCWAFSVTGNVEGQWAINKGKLLSLSEQELVDCDKLDEGCNGGLPTNAYKEIIRIGGLESESDYPYKGKDNKCSFDKTEVEANVTGAVNISQNEDDMAAWLAKSGPISIGINAFAMQFYFGGISHPWKIFCEPSGIDHGVLIVGYGVKDGKTPYWIVKNSWGASWGEKGYYYVYRGGGVCGLNLMASSATVV